MSEFTSINDAINSCNLLLVTLKESRFLINNEKMDDLSGILKLVRLEAECDKIRKTLKKRMDALEEFNQILREEN